MHEDYCNRCELPKMYTISKIIDEAHHHKSIFFSGKIDCKPGQFVMVWLPGVEEKPMAVSYLTPKEFAFTYHTLGKFTQGLDKLKKGNKLGIRGPYGKSFSLKKNAIVVGGGVGLSSVSTLIDKLSKSKIIHGARSKEFLLFTKRYKNMILCTDDGSFGRKGFVTSALEDELKKGKVSIVYTCGPELMMKKVIELCNKHTVACEASLERFMKCGFGICGNCMVDDKILCLDGPVFDRKTLNSLKDFGNFARLKTGRKVTLKEYYGWRN